jgi:hypothetical protein
MSDEDDDEEDDIIAMVPISESSKLVSLEKMVWLLAVLVENSRGDDNRVSIFLLTFFYTLENLRQSLYTIS